MKQYLHIRLTWMMTRWLLTSQRVVLLRIKSHQ